jgi:hypothetical protein
MSFSSLTRESSDSDSWRNLRERAARHSIGGGYAAPNRDFLGFQPVFRPAVLRNASKNLTLLAGTIRTGEFDEH